MICNDEKMEFRGFDEEGWRLLNSTDIFREGDQYIGFGGYDDGWHVMDDGLYGMNLADVMFLWARRKVKNKQPI